jgi:hypothetical protein
MENIPGKGGKGDRIEKGGQDRKRESGSKKGDRIEKEGQDRKRRSG